ncbi:MAG: ABC transporter ATP-binding protein [Pseudomonadota bacterium]
MKHGQSLWRGLAADFMAYAGKRAWLAGALILGGSVLEGVSLVMLIPIIGIVLAGESSVAEPYLAGFFSAVGVESTAAKLGIVVVGFAVLSMLRLAVSYRREILLASLDLGFVADKRRQIFRLISEQPWATAMQIEQGKLAHILGRDLDRATNAAPMWLRLFGLSVNVAVQLTLAMMLAPIITLAIVLVGAVAFWLLRPLRQRAHRIGQGLTRTDYRLFSSTAEFLRGLKPAKAHGLEGTYLDRLTDASEGYKDQNVLYRRDVALSSAVIQGLAVLLALAVVLAGHFWAGADPAVLVVVLIILMRMAGPLQQVQQLFQNALHHGAAYTAAMAALADMKPVSGTATTAASERLTAAPGFKLHGLTWSPPGSDHPVLEDLTVEVPAGQVTAIAGRSGAGKSTLSDLIVGLLKPDHGRITMNGAALDTEALARLRASLAYIGQDGTLLQASVRELLAWGASTVSEDEIWTELERVGIADQIRAEPSGLDTPLRGEASRFSGGERQRLRLARALLRRPRMIVLDEATNALDPAAEHGILGDFLSAREGATVIMISHRADTLALADHIIDLDHPMSATGEAPPARTASEP